MTAQRQRAEAEEIPYRPQGGREGFVEGGWQWCGGQDGTGGKREGVQVGVKLVRVSMENKKY